MQREVYEGCDGSPMVSIAAGLSPEAVRAVERDAMRSWANLPSPPKGYSRGTLLLLMLQHKGYEMNPRTFAWDDSSDQTYMSMWRMCEKFVARGSLSGSIEHLVLGRSVEGYAALIPERRGRAPIRLDMLKDRPLVSAFLCRYWTQAPILSPEGASEELELKFDHSKRSFRTLESSMMEEAQSCFEASYDKV